MTTETSIARTVDGSTPIGTRLRMTEWGRSLRPAAIDGYLVGWSGSWVRVSVSGCIGLYHTDWWELAT